MSEEKIIKVLLIGPYPPPIGGQSVLVETIFNNGLEHSIKYTLLNSTHNERNVVKRSFISCSFIFNLLVLLLFKSNTFDIVHIHTSAGRPLFEKCFLGLICRLFGKPIIIHIHGGKLKAMFMDAGKAKHFLIKQFLRVPSLIIVLSNKMEEIIKNEVSNNLSIKVLENATKVSPDNLKIDEFKKRKDTITLLFVGQLKIEKGLLDLLDAYKVLEKLTPKRIELKIVGGADNSNLENDFKKLYKESGVQGVQFTGVLTGVDLKKVYEQSDIFVLPSHSEDQPLTIIEAMSFGLPVVSTKVGSIPDLIQEDINGFLVVPKDIEALLERLKVLVDSEETRCKIGKSNQTYAKKHFGFDNYMTNLRSLYQKVLS